MSLVTGSARAAQPFPVLRLRGLDPALRYRVDGGEVHSGAALMYAGLSFPLVRGDYQAKQLHLEAV